MAGSRQHEEPASARGRRRAHESRTAHVDGSDPAPRESRAGAVLELVDAIPSGRVMTYGDVARHLGIPSARLVGRVLADRGDAVAWHRVVLSTGDVAAHLVERQLALLRSEGVAIRGNRVELRSARWSPTSPDRSELPLPRTSGGTHHDAHL